MLILFSWVAFIQWPQEDDSQNKKKVPVAFHQHRNDYSMLMFQPHYKVDELPQQEQNLSTVSGMCH